MSESKPGARDRLEDCQDRQVVRETAASQKRFWLKIANACNNNCLFCLDADKRTGVPFLPFDEVRRHIAAGFRQGFERLILSGGEASIHPDFIRIIEAGADAGFGAIQTISNGRMFSYPGFAAQAVAAGLSEVTFSIHGHTAALHDRLTRVPGSFAQASRGIRNVLNTGGCVVNIDIVVNKQNYMHVGDIIERFSREGIFEYDLLHVVPFGHAQENGDQLYFSIDEAFGHLKEVFSLSQRAHPHYHIWSNRFPPAYLEDNESLIQSPVKLYDEIHGRKALFEDYCRGKERYCFPHNCSRCFVQPLCGAIQVHNEMRRHPSAVKRICASDFTPALCAFLKEAPALMAISIPFARNEVEQIRSALGHLPDEPVLVCNRRSDLAGLVQTESDLSNITVAFEELDEELLQFAFVSGFREICILLNASTVPVLLRNLQAFLNLSNLVFSIPGFEKLNDARIAYADLMTVLGCFPDVPVLHCAPCLHRKGISQSENWISFAAIAQPESLDFGSLIRHYIINDYFVRARGCDTCAFSSNCAGMHVNFVRLFGFSAMKPVRQSS